MTTYFKNWARDKVVIGSFDSVLKTFGVNAMMARTMTLCRNYPDKIVRMFRDFITTEQWDEIDNVMKKNPGMSKRNAFISYTMCTLLVSDKFIFMRNV